MRKPFRYASIGSVSRGTLRTQDLLASFAYELKQLAYGVNAGHSELAKEAQRLADRSDEWTEEDEEYAVVMVNEDLYYALDEYAPPFCYFGSHEGDGADIGFWISSEALEEAIRDGDTDENGDVIYDGYRINISDHGNVEVYDAKGKSLMSCV